MPFNISVCFIDSPTPTQFSFTTQVPSAVANTITKHHNNNDKIFNGNNINIETELLQREAEQQLHDLYATTLQQNVTTITTASEKSSSNFVTIPLSERPPLICLTQQQQQVQSQIQQQQQNGNNHHENCLNSSLTRSSSCLVRWRQFCSNCKYFQNKHKTKAKRIKMTHRTKFHRCFMAFKVMAALWSRIAQS